MSNQTLVVGSTYTETVTCAQTYTYSNRYKCTLTVILNSVDEDNLTANVTLKNTLQSTNYTAWASDEITFAVKVDGVTKASTKASSGGTSSSSTGSKTYTTWTGDIPYTEDGTLVSTLQATVSGAGSNHAPGNATAEIVATFPSIEVGNAYIGINGVPTRAQVYIGVNGVPKKCDVYIGVNGVPTKCG